MKRHLVAVPGAIALLLFSWGSAPSGQHQTSASLSGDLLVHPQGSHLHHVIVQGDGQQLLQLRRGGFGVLRRETSGGSALDVTDAQLDALSHNPLITHISGDLPVTAHVAVTNTVTGATSVWQGNPGLLGLLGTPADTGVGVTVAVLDSGIATHSALGSRVIAHVNMVSAEPSVSGDPFGHGTHVAGIIGGSGAVSATPDYNGGSAPGVKFVDVRVLGSNGSGQTSDVIAGIDWVIAHRTTYKIRVINLSLGHPITEPSAADPLCQAVANAVASGITVVVSAGNYGQAPSGAPELGGITSPGNSPWAITVGAVDTNGTTSTSDDAVAPFSSRGPAEYELVVKPDIVAPGVKIVSLEASGSFLSRTYPQWHIAGTGTNAYMRLSGTSMSTAVVSGGAALLLSANPSLSPSQVKIALQMGARYMRDGGLVGGGAGDVNFAQSMKIANQGLLNSLLSTVTSVLGLSSGATYRDDYGTLIDNVYNRSGIRLLNILGLGNLFQGADNETPGMLNLLGSSNPLGTTAPNYLVWGNVAGWTSSYYLVWGNTIQDPQGEYLVWGNSDTTDSNYLVWGNSVGGGPQHH